MILPPDGGAMTAEGTRALRGALVAAGFPFLPEITGLKFSSKAFADWRDRDTPFDPALDYSNQYGLLLNTGLVLQGLVAIDLDIDQADDVALAIDLMHEHLGAAVCQRSRANSPRRAVLYRTDDQTGLYASAKGTDGMIEVFSGNKTKVSAFGYHTNKVTRQRVRMNWQQVPGNITHQELPLVTMAQVTDYLDAAADVLGEDTEQRRRVPGSAPPQVAEALRARDLHELYAAASCVPNTGACDWHCWNRWAMALYAASGGDDLGLLAFCEWTLKNPNSAHRNCLARWQAIAQCPPTMIGAGSVFQAAIAAGFRRSVQASAKWREEKQQEKRIRDWKPKI